MSVADLLAALGSTPNLAGAQCVGADMSGRTPEAVEAALALCRRCPAQVQCRRWWEDRGHQLGVGGVVAGQVVVPRIVSSWAPRPERTAPAPFPQGSKRARAVDWLRDLLAAGDGIATSAQVQTAAAGAGFDRQTLYWARKRAGIVAERQGIGHGTSTVWRLR